VSKPITRDVLLKLLDTCEDNIRGERDRALLLVGFAGGGRRRSELAKLRVEDLHRVKGGYLGTLQNHKTFKITREPLIFPILGDAAKALDTWLKTGQISCGSIFRGLHRSGRVLGPINPKTVNRIIKDRCKKAGLSTENFGAHSLRSGFMTQAASDGIAFTDIMQISGHRSVEAAAKYLRPVAILKNRAAWLGNIPEPHAIAAMRNSAYKRRKGLEDNIVTLNASRRRR
jgi:integrase